MSARDNFKIELLPKQKQAMFSVADVIGYGGSLGGGKSALIKLMAIYMCYNQPHLQFYIFRRTFPEISTTFLSGDFGFPVLLGPYVDAGFCTINWSKHQINFTNGACIHMCHCQNAKDIYKYQGISAGVICIDEASLWPHDMYRYLMSRLRIAHDVRPEFKDMLPRALLTFNPGGVGHDWLKREFVDFCPDGEIVNYEGEYSESRHFIRSKLQDNPYLDGDLYAERVKGLGDKQLVKAMLDGDFDIAIGAFFEESFSAGNVIAHFKIPNNWTKTRGFDWGSANPGSVLWYAESNGEDVILSDGSTMHTIRGDKFVFAEWYIDDGNEKGLRLSATEIAVEILKHESRMRNSLYEGVIKAGVADSAIYTKESNNQSIAQVMQKEGVKFIPSKKGPNSRVLGWQTCIEKMRNATASPREKAGVFVFNTCRRLISHIKTIQRDPRKPEDLDTNGNDHDLDNLSYNLRQAKPVVKTRQF